MSERIKRERKKLLNNIFAKEYILKYLMPLRSNYSEIEFEMRSWDRWAVEEAFNYVDAHPELPTQDALEEFIKMMDRYSCMAKSDEASRMFAQAKATGEDILDHYLISQFYNGGKKE